MKKCMMDVKTPLFAALLVACALSAFAAPIAWKGASGGAWNNTANWEGGVVPNGSGVEVDFSTASGTYSVNVDVAVTVGKITVNGATATTLTLSGSKITFTGSSTPEVLVGSGHTLYLQNYTGGNQGLRKTGEGTYRPTGHGNANNYTGRTYVDAGIMFPVKSDGGALFGGSVEVATGATLKWPTSDVFGSTFKTIINGGTADLNDTVGDYVGALTFANGGLFKAADSLTAVDRYLVIEDPDVAKISTSGDGFAGTFKGRLFLSSPFLASSRGTIPVRTQEVNVASANATFAMTGYIFDRMAQARYDDIYAKEYRTVGNDGVTPYPYQFRGQLMKTGDGDLLLYDETISLTGPTTVNAGRLVLSNSVKMCASTVKLPNGNSSLVVADGATLKLSGIDSPDRSSLDLNGASLDIGGMGEDAVFAGTLANGGTIRKTGYNSQTLSAPQTQRDWDVLGGTLHFGVPAPVVWYKFDDEDLGKDSGVAGKHLSVSNAAGVVWSNDGVDGGCASFDGTGCLKADTGAGLPGGNSPFTIALWIKPNRNGYSLVSYGNEVGGNFSGFVGDGTTKLKHAFWEGAYDVVSTAISGSFTDGTWRHVAITYDPATWTRKFYVNGTLLSSHVNKMSYLRKVDLSKPFHIGLCKYNNNYIGKMDDVMVFDKVLTEEDVATLANLRKDATRTALTPDGGNVRLEAGATVSFTHAEESFASISGRGTLGLYDSTAAIAPAANVTNEVGRLVGDGTLVKNGAGTLSLSRLQNAGGKLDVRTGTVTAKGPAKGLKDHLVAWWTFDDPENPGADASGNGMDVTCITNKAQGAFTCESWNWRNRFETTGGAAYFDGNNKRYLVLANKANEAKLPHGSEPSFTVAMWINPDSNMGNNAGFYYWGGLPAAALNSHGCRLNGGTQLFLWFWGAGGVSYTLPSNFKSDAVPTGWHHVACTTGNHWRRMYVDGVLVDEVNHPGTPNIPAQNFSLGFDPSQNGAGAKGYMDDVMIFDKALTADEVRAVMQGVLLDEPAGGMAAATASGTTFEVTDGQVAFGGLAATGTVNVASSAEALFASGENELVGGLGGTGLLTVTNGASLHLGGGQTFGGTLSVEAGGVLDLRSGASATVQNLNLAEGAGIAVAASDSTATPCLTASTAVALPSAANVRMAVSNRKGVKVELLHSDVGLTGSVDGWTVDWNLPGRSWRSGLTIKGNSVWAEAHPLGIIVTVF